MRDYAIQATVKGDDEKVYGTEITVQGPDTLDEFIALMGNSGVMDVLVTNFRQEQAAQLRGKISAKIGKEKETGGGRLANAIRVDV